MPPPCQQERPIVCSNFQTDFTAHTLTIYSIFYEIQFRCSFSLGSSKLAIICLDICPRCLYDDDANSPYSEAFPAKSVGLMGSVIDPLQQFSLDEARATIEPIKAYSLVDLSEFYYIYHAGWTSGQSSSHASHATLANEPVSPLIAWLTNRPRIRTTFQPSLSFFPSAPHTLVPEHKHLPTSIPSNSSSYPKHQTNNQPRTETFIVLRSPLVRFLAT